MHRPRRKRLHNLNTGPQARGEAACLIESVESESLFFFVNADLRVYVTEDQWEGLRAEAWLESLYEGVVPRRVDEVHLSVEPHVIVASRRDHSIGGIVDGRRVVRCDGVHGQSGVVRYVLMYPCRRCQPCGVDGAVFVMVGDGQGNGLDDGESKYQGQDCGFVFPADKGSEEEQAWEKVRSIAKVDMPITYVCGKKCDAQKDKKKKD